MYGVRALSCEPGGLAAGVRLGVRRQAGAAEKVPLGLRRAPVAQQTPESGNRRCSSKFLFPEGSGAGISTPSASADPLLAGAGTAASAVVGCSRERARAASSALADIAAGSRCYPRDVFAAARPLLLLHAALQCNRQALHGRVSKGARMPRARRRLLRRRRPKGAPPRPSSRKSPPRTG